MDNKRREKRKKNNVGAGKRKGMGVSLPDLKGSVIIAGKNPVKEALISGHKIRRIYINSGSKGRADDIEALALKKGVKTERIDKDAFFDLVRAAADDSDVTHQGVIAVAEPYKYSSLDDILRLSEEREEDPFVIILDGIEDPHNLGAILRSAECAGAHGVVIQKRNACGLNATVAKSSAGAIEYVPCAEVTNISRAIEELKERGLWIFALDMDGEEYSGKDLKGPVGLVVGAEGKGVSRLVKEKCDGVVSIPLKGKIDSLNASNAACVLMYEVMRQRSGS